MTTKIDGTLGVDLIKDGTVKAADFDPSLFLASKTGNGYQKLPSGLIIQWGSTVITTSAADVWAGGDGNVPLPIAFPTAGLVSFANSPNMAQLSGQSLSLSISIYNLSTLSLRALTQLAGVSGISVQWIAIGY